MGRIFSARIFLLCIVFAVPASAKDICTYRSWSWSTQAGKAVNHIKVSKPYIDLSLEEVDPQTGCTICEEDQVEIHLPRLRPFKVCHILASGLEQLLHQLLAQGEPILSISGYRVGRTRGDVNSDGLRTRFSNHAYGIALDINPDQNGLYGNCLEFNQACRLLRGGHWQPGQFGSLTTNSPTVIGLKHMGLFWGGEIRGKQKDFMHFSPSGY